MDCFVAAFLGLAFLLHPNLIRADAVKFEAVPAKVLEEGQGSLSALEHSASEEGFLARLFNIDCYSDALAELNTDCKRLDHEQRNRLALALANCQLSRLGARTHPCFEFMSLKECTEKMDLKAYHTFSEFFTHIDSMCLFLQNQNFQQATENTMNQLYKSSSAAAAHLQTINASLAVHNQQLLEVEGRIEDLGSLQAEVHQSVVENLEVARVLEEKALVLDSKVQKALQHEEALLGKQQALMHSLDELSDQERQHALDAGQHWEAAAHTAQVVIQHFEEFRGLQHELEGNYRHMVDQSQGLRSTLDLVLEYEQRSDAVLISLLGQSWSISDLLFYTAGAALAFVLTSMRMTQRARIPLLLLLISTFVLERVLLDKLHGWLGLGTSGQVVVNVPMPRWLPVTAGMPIDQAHFFPLNLKKVVRGTAVALAVLYLARMVWHYMDYEQLNYRAVLSLEEQMRESEERLRKLLERQRRASIAEMSALLVRHGVLPAPQSPALQASDPGRMQGVDGSVGSGSLAPLPHAERPAHNETEAPAPALGSPPFNALSWPDQTSPTQLPSSGDADASRQRAECSSADQQQRQRPVRDLDDNSQQSTHCTHVDVGEQPAACLPSLQSGVQGSRKRGADAEATPCSTASLKRRHTDKSQSNPNPGPLKKQQPACSTPESGGKHGPAVPTTDDGPNKRQHV